MFFIHLSQARFHKLARYQAVWISFALGKIGFTICLTFHFIVRRTGGLIGASLRVDRSPCAIGDPKEGVKVLVFRERHDMILSTFCDMYIIIKQAGWDRTRRRVMQLDSVSIFLDVDSLYTVVQ